jgi:hypothetical protein
LSIEAVSLVLNHSKAHGRAKLVLIGIANHMGDQGAWPSIATLARYANSSERSVKRDIQDLVALGELIVELQAAPTQTQYKTNRYWITISGVTDSVSGVTTQVIRGDRLGKSGVTPGGTQNINITIKEPSMNIAQDFEKFWAVYPHKTGKLAAQRAFAKALTVTDFDTLLAGAVSFANDPNLPSEKKYIKHPATWLNAGCWDDEPLPVDPKAQVERSVEASKRSVEASKAATRDLLAEQAEWAVRVAENPPEYCVHGRVKVICRETH